MALWLYIRFDLCYQYIIYGGRVQISVAIDRAFSTQTFYLGRDSGLYKLHLSETEVEYRHRFRYNYGIQKRVSVSDKFLTFRYQESWCSVCGSLDKEGMKLFLLVCAVSLIACLI